MIAASLEFVALTCFFAAVLFFAVRELSGGKTSRFTNNLLQGGAASKDRSARVAHNHEVAGSNPAPATNSLAEAQGSTSHGRPVGGYDARSAGGGLTALRSLVAQPANAGSEIPPGSFIEPEDLHD